MSRPEGLHRLGIGSVQGGAVAGGSGTHRMARASIRPRSRSLARLDSSRAFRTASQATRAGRASTTGRLMCGPWAIGHPPPGHGARRVKLGGPPEGAAGLVVVEGEEEVQALVEIALGGVGGGCHLRLCEPSPSRIGSRRPSPTSWAETRDVGISGSPGPKQARRVMATAVPRLSLISGPPLGDEQGGLAMT